MTELIDLHGTAMSEFDRRVREVTLTDWALPTPCADWDVHDLVNHLTIEQLWVPSLLDGARVEDLDDRFDGDVLGEEPVTTWEVAAREARTAWLSSSAREGTVHLSFGDAPAELYLWQMTFDLTVHAWDLARALETEESLDAELVDQVLSWAEEQGFGEQKGTEGLFEPPVEIDAHSSPQDQLIALTGRTP